LVGYNFRLADRDQDLLLPVSLTEWLDEDHLVWFVLGAVAQMDLSRFYASYRSDGWGRAANEPSMMVALLLYAYCLGVRSSRAIEKACGHDVAFRVLTANQVPDHTTIARFRVRHEKALAAVLGASPRLCAQAGMVNVGRVALDGTKMGCPAALSANKTKDHIDAAVEVMLAEAAAADAEKDATPGIGVRGDEPAAHLRGATTRRQRFIAAKAVLDAAAETARAEYEQRLVDRVAAEKASGAKTRGRKPTAPSPDVRAKANISDLDSRIMKTRDGYVQGYSGHRKPDRDRR
jgi:transposase